MWLTQQGQKCTPHFFEEKVTFDADNQLHFTDYITQIVILNKL